jgi:predicted nucleic acid-binding protein
VKVVDASAIVAVIFGEVTRDLVAARLDGEELAAPKLLPLEVANACLKKIRRHPSERTLLIAAYATLGAWRISYHDIDLDAVFALGDRAGLSSYDASYLWLAQELGTELVTLDKELARAAAIP